MGEASVDLRVCPHCGRADFRLVSEERLYGYADIRLAGDPAAGFTAEWAGATEMDWASSTTTVYLCRDCDGVLPEWYAAVLDGLLGTVREPTPTTEWHQSQEEDREG